MKQKIIIVLVIVLIFILAVGIAYLIDMHCMENDKPGVFSTWRYNYAPPEIQHNVVQEPDVHTSGKESETNEDDEINSFFGTVVESNLSYIIVEPSENEAIRNSADKISIGLEKNNDALYVVGTNVKVTYKGGIMEKYHAQVNVVDIEIKSVEEFEIRFYDKRSESAELINEIAELNRGLSKKDGTYKVYSYGGSVNILIDGEEMSLKEALENNRITMNEIIQKANRDFPNAVSYDDGGTKEYHYENYTIIKCHILDGNRDVYFCNNGITLNDLEI